jgi:hypothetical protein
MFQVTVLTDGAWYLSIKLSQKENRGEDDIHNNFVKIYNRANGSYAKIK